MVLLTLLLGLGGFGWSASDHSGSATHVLGTTVKPPFPNGLTFGEKGGRKINVDHWMMEQRPDGRCSWNKAEV